MTNAGIVPPGRTDITAKFLQLASDDQIEMIKNKARAIAGSSNPPFNWAAYAVYNPTVGVHQDKVEDVPSSALMWFFRFDSPNGEDYYLGGRQGCIDGNSWTTDPYGYISLGAYREKSYDYAHQVFPRLAPPGYLAQVELERAEIENAERDDEDDEDYIDYDDDDNLF